MSGTRGKWRKSDRSDGREVWVLEQSDGAAHVERNPRPYIYAIHGANDSYVGEAHTLEEAMRMAESESMPGWDRHKETREMAHVLRAEWARSVKAERDALREAVAEFRALVAELKAGGVA